MKKTEIFENVMKEALTEKVAIYVPGTQNATEATDNTQQVKNTLRKLSDLFGGATANAPAAGAWNSSEHGLIIESVTVCFAYCKRPQLVENFPEVLNICEDLKREMNQECISLQINNNLIFI